MSLPLVSVVMPVYNAEKYLKEAIDSILSQSYKNIELIVVNDGSTDSSKDIILSYTDPRIRLVNNEKNSGIVFTRNRGLDSANGVYIATLDSDDIATPGKLEKQVRFLEENLSYGMCGTFYTIIDGQGNLHQNIRFPTDNRDIITYLIVRNCFCNSTTMIRTPLAKELKYQEHFDIVEDYEMWSRISKRARMANLSFYGTYYRVHGTNNSVSKINDMFARVKKINRNILTGLDITFSERELDMHSNFLETNVSFFKDKNRINELESWLSKFYQKVRGHDEYNHSLLYGMIIDRWLVITFKNRRFNKLFFNTLIVFNKSGYLRSLTGKIFLKTGEMK